MNGPEILMSVALGLAVNECCDVSPWLAGKVVRWSARRRYAGDPARAAIRAEELTALLDARPGKLFKLTTALGFAGSAIAMTAPGALAHQPVRLIRRTPTPLAGAVLGAGLVVTWLVLYAYQVNLPEAYTLPLAAVALLVGMLVALRDRPDLSSWRCYGIALVAGFTPTFALIWFSPSMVRLAALVAAAALAFLVGALRRLKAPVVVGALVLPVAVIVLLAHLMPGALLAAILLAGGGVAFLVLGARYERRRRDLSRLHAALGRMVDAPTAAPPVG